MDNKNRQDNRDRNKVDSNDPSEVEYLHRQHKQYSHEQIVDAIKKYGPYREDIEKHLQSGKM
ncbi:DUF3606 domain-containing protein [Parafilimonas sp.]|uniref:DUF3606 domain-containing protein n=1 Tax=Parafilimonas sp. TaxID=1969739 RepID=UPI0039E38AF0